MGTSLDWLPSSLSLPVLFTVFIVALILQRRFHERAERKRSETELLRFSNLQLLTSTLSEAEDPKQMVDRTLDGTLQALGLSDGCMMLRVEGPDGVEYSKPSGLSDTALARLLDGPLYNYLISACDRWGTVMVFADLLRPDLMAAWHRDPLFQEFREVFTAEGLRSLLVLSLQTKERSYGVLIVGSRPLRTFRPGELRLMLAIGNQVSVALENRLLQKAAERHHEELKILHHIGDALGSIFDPKMQVQVLQRELKGWLGPVDFFLAFQETPGGPLQAVGATENGDAQDESKGKMVVDGLSDYVLRTQAPLMIARDFLITARRLGITLIDPRIRTWCGVPLHLSDGSMGVLAVADFQRENALDERDFQLLQVCAGEAAVALENARLFQGEQRRARHLTLLNELGRKAAAVLDPKELLAILCSQVREAFAYDLVRIQIVDRERNELVVEAQEGYRSAILGRRFEMGEGLPGICAETGEAVLSNDVENDERYAPIHHGVRSALSLPLKYRAETLGVLTIESLKPNSFSHQDVLTIGTLADQVAVALRNAQTYQVAQEQAITDGLTGLKTHRYFMEALEAEWRRAPRSRRPFSLIMMDLDGFKHINDRQGHLEGDKVLNAVAQAIGDRSRQSNIVARYGGDEFAILLPDCATDQAVGLAERLRIKLAASPYLASHSVTASFGIATFPHHGATPDDILRVADCGMYLAKHENGNSVRVALGNGGVASLREQQLLQAYLGVAVKRLFSTGPDAFNQYLEHFRQVTQEPGRPSLPLMDTVTALAFAIDAKDHYTQGHSQAVAQLASQIGKQVGLSEEELEEIRLAGILHDIGKIGIPETLLNKPARLTAEEFEIMKSHAPLGARILEPLKVKAIERIRQMVRHHHERWDGKGYPDGLKGEDIPIGARILTIADCFDTMVSDRVYKKAQPVEEVLEELRLARGQHLDAKLVDAFFNSLAETGDPRSEARKTAN
ncbi:MAG: diguanylate cyclase [Acidobacteria bacterium]|nr:diguanylate cyclase [Acidobacteriota bacterium]